MTTPTNHLPSSTSGPESPTPESPPSDTIDVPSGEASEPAPTFVKLAMRNMVRQGSKSIFHFALTTVGLLGLLVGLAYITR